MIKIETFTRADANGPYLINRTDLNPNLTIEDHINSFLKNNKEYIYIAQNKNGSIYAYKNKPKLSKDIFKSKLCKCLVGYVEYNKVFNNWESSLIDTTKDEFYIGSEYELYRIRVDKRN